MITKTDLGRTLIKYLETLLSIALMSIMLFFISCNRSQTSFSYITEKVVTDTSVTYAVKIRTDPNVTVEYGRQRHQTEQAGQATVFVPSRDLPLSKSSIQVILVGEDGVKSSQQVQIDNTPPSFSCPSSVVASEAASGKWSFKVDMHTGPLQSAQVNGVPLKSSPEGAWSFMCDEPELDPFVTSSIVRRYYILLKEQTGDTWQGFVDIKLSYPEVDVNLDFRGNDISQRGYGDVLFKGSSLTILGVVTVRSLVAGLVVQGRPVMLRPDGSFECRARGLQLGKNTIELILEGTSGKTITKTIHVVRVPTDAERVADYGRRAAKISYAMLAKNPARHQGQLVRFLGKIFHIEEDKSSTAMQVNVTSQGWGMWDDQIMVHYPMETDFVQGDLVWVCGTVRGPITYTSVAGWTITVPMIDAEYLGKYESEY